MDVIQDQITTEPISTIRQATCPSLSGRSKLTYTVGKTSGKDILIRIEKNSSTGKFNNEWIPAEDILKLIDTAESPFTSAVLISLYEHKSVNSAGFLMAILKQEGLVQSVEDGGYERTDKNIKSLLTKSRKGGAKS